MMRSYLDLFLQYSFLRFTKSIWCFVSRFLLMLFAIQCGLFQPVFTILFAETIQSGYRSHGLELLESYVGCCWMNQAHWLFSVLDIDPARAPRAFVAVAAAAAAMSICVFAAFDSSGDAIFNASEPCAVENSLWFTITFNHEFISIAIAFVRWLSRTSKLFALFMFITIWSTAIPLSRPFSLLCLLHHRTFIFIFIFIFIIIIYILRSLLFVLKVPLPLPSYFHLNDE